MSRKKGPALYELISQKQLSLKPPEYHNRENDLDHNVLTPGRSVRMSIGTIGVMIAVSITLIVVSYTMGFKRATAIAEEDYGNRIFEELPASAFTEVKTVAAPVKMPEIKQTTPIEPYSWGALHSDPRVAGYNYFILIETNAEGAQQLAVFCRERGLETYVISGNNTSFHKVIALPGSLDSSDPAVIALRSKILTIGSQWAQTAAGRGSDLQDAYQSLYN